ncbi:MAG: Mut7-C RNAse domain-containing protein [Desulfobacterales bacterium]
MAIHIELRFYEELNDFLPSRESKRTFSRRIDEPADVRNILDMLGVPVSAVDLVLVNGLSVPFAHTLENGDRVAVYPRFESFDISTVTRVRDAPLRRPRFILDVHLGKLAKYLRLLGFDSLYHNNLSDDHIIRIAETGDRTILTRDRNLATSAKVFRAYRMQTTSPQKQVVEVIDRFQLSSAVRPFSRCLSCNAAVQKIGIKQVRDRLDPRIASRFSDYTMCTGCGKIYWKGTHYESMVRFVQQVTQASST